MQRLKQALAEMGDGPTEFPALLSVGSKREDDDCCFQIEDSWRQFADKETVSQLSKKQTTQQEAMWEIIKTEVQFIKDIRIAIDFYLCTFLNLQASVILNEIETESIFSNVYRIEAAHSRFWKEKLSMVVKNAREEKRLFSVMDLADAFDGFADLFACYSTYNLTRKECMVYLKDKTKNNDTFRYFVEWAQKHQRSKKKKLNDLLCFPMARLTKYSLFLSVVGSATPDGRPKAELARRTAEVGGFLGRLLHESSPEDDGEPRIAVEDEVVATLNPRSPTAMRHSAVGPCGSPQLSPRAAQSPKLKRLNATLDELLTHGLQDFPALLSFSGNGGADETDGGGGGGCFHVEESWRSLVDRERADSLDAVERSRQDAFWDLVTSEAALVRGIGTVVDFYSRTLINLQASMVLNEIETEKVFGSIGAVRAAHTGIWREKLLPVLRMARAERRLPTAADMAGALRGLVDLLAPYIRLVVEQVTGLEYLKEQMAANEMLRHFLDWAERHPDGGGLRLYDLLLSPVRQLCRYPVLLTAISETAEGRPRVDLLARRSSVDEFLGRLSRLAERKKGGAEQGSPEVCKLLQLQQTLSEVMINGLQDFPSLLAFGTKREDDKECFQIRETWRELASKGEPGDGAGGEVRERQEAVWEIVLAEVCFIEDVRLVVDLYLSTLLNLQAAMLLNEIETEKIFRNVTAVEQLHTRFWKTKLAGVVGKALAEPGGSPPLLPASDLADAFRGFATAFAPYAKFCNSRNACAAYLKQRVADNPSFAFFLDWVRAHPRSGGLGLADLLEAPVRRIAEYPVLLEALEKTPGSQDRLEVARRKSEVREFVTRVLSSTRGESAKGMRETDASLQRSGAFRSSHLSGSASAAESAGESGREVRTRISLQKALDDLTVKGIPDAPSLPSSGAKGREAEECSRVEKLCVLWRRQADQQEAIRKIITAELGIIRDIRVVVGLYLGGLLGLQSRGLLADVRAERIFGNVASVEEAHAGFWREGLSRVVGRAEAEARPPSLPDLAGAFAGFADRFAPYAEFCRSHAERAAYLRERTESDERLAAFLAWARRHPDSQGPCLGDLLDYCAERVAAYPRLLADLEKTLDFPDRARLSPRIKEVRGFVAQLSA